MRILSFDTSTDTLQLCLFEDGKIVLERSGFDGASSTDGAQRQQMVAMLLPLIDESMRKAGWNKGSLDCIVVGQGPGSFTGIRSGVVTARTLAQALNLPLIAVCLLETLASTCPLPVAVILPAGKERYFVAAYEDSALGQLSAHGSLDTTQNVPNLRTTASPACVSSPEITSIIGAIPRWAYEKSSLLSPEVCAGHEVIDLPNVKNIATRQAQIAWNRLSLTMSKETNGEFGVGGEAADPTTERAKLLRHRLLESFCFENVQPLYLRSPSITVKRTAQPQQACE